MQRPVPLLLVASTLLLAPTAPTRADGALPMRVGACVTTRIATIGNRLGDTVGGRFVSQPGTGSAVTMANRGYQVSYEQVPAVDRSRPGDPVRMCLVSIPTGCPKGDSRGRIYRTVNLRTRASWTLPDSEHACGGA